MSNTYSQCYFHLVFSPAQREALINKSWSEQLCQYICAVIQNNNHKLLAIKAMPDHIHILIGYNLNEKIPDLLNEIKTSSTKWVNSKKFSKFRFNWQVGYGAFTYSKSQINSVIRYIINQERHHQKRTFREEYLEILQKNEVDFKEEYLFEFFD